jgi:hypothetical protein
MEHSGDKIMNYGLQHLINFSDKEFERAYVISSPWAQGQPTNIAELDKTDPILEMRVEMEDGSKKRYVIPQDYTNGFRNTACVNAIVSSDKENNKMIVTVRRDFIDGYADATDALIKSVKKLN